MNRKQKLRLALKALVENDDRTALRAIDQALLDKKRINMRSLVLKFSHESNIGGVSVYYRAADTLYCFKEFRDGAFKFIDCDDTHLREVPFERIKMMDLSENPAFNEFMRGMLG